MKSANYYSLYERPCKRKTRKKSKFRKSIKKFRNYDANNLGKYNTIKKELDATYTTLQKAFD